jgi:hypothetical protein
METEDIPPATLKPAPVTVPCEIVTVAPPVLDSVRFWGLLDPAATLPKLRLVELGASVPEELEFEFEFDFPGGVPAPVKPTQPERARAARDAKSRTKKPDRVRRLKAFSSEKRKREFGCEFIAGPE